MVVRAHLGHAVASGRLQDDLHRWQVTNFLDDAGRQEHLKLLIERAADTI